MIIVCWWYVGVMNQSFIISAWIQTGVIACDCVSRPHRYEWNSNWVRNVWWANGSAMLPGWPVLCLVCQGEGLFGLHRKSLCLWLRQQTRQVWHWFTFERLVCVCIDVLSSTKRWLLCLSVSAISSWVWAEKTWRRRKLCARKMSVSNVFLWDVEEQ